MLYLVFTTLMEKDNGVHKIKVNTMGQRLKTSPTYESNV